MPLVAALVLVASVASSQTRFLHVEDLTWPELRDAVAAGAASVMVHAGGVEQNGPLMASITPVPAR